MPWLVAVVDPGARRRYANDDLANAGYHVYTPIYRTRVKIRGRRIWRTRPLFGPYVFIELRDDWPALLQLRGVHAVLLTADQTPCTIADAAIAELRAREIDGYVVVPPQLRHAGQQVRVVSGPLQGAIGTWLRSIVRHDSELIAIAHLGRVEIAAGAVAPV